MSKFYNPDEVALTIGGVVMRGFSIEDATFCVNVVPQIWHDIFYADSKHVWVDITTGCRHQIELKLPLDSLDYKRIEALEPSVESPFTLGIKDEG